MALSRVQSVVTGACRPPDVQRASQSARMRGAAKMSVVCSRMPVTLSPSPASAAASARFTRTRTASWSRTPTSNTPATVSSRSRDVTRPALVPDGHEHANPVAGTDAEAHGEGAAQQRLPGPGGEIGQRPAAQRALEARDGRLPRRVDPFDDRAGQLAADGHHGFELHVGGRGLHAGKALDVGQDVAPGRFAIAGEHGAVAGDGDEPRAQLVLEAVHDRQHDDERRHAKRHADDGRERDEGRKLVRALRAQVTQGDPDRGGSHHAASATGMRRSTQMPSGVTRGADGHDVDAIRRGRTQRPAVGGIDLVGGFHHVHVRALGAEEDAGPGAGAPENGQLPGMARSPLADGVGKEGAPGRDRGGHVLDLEVVVRQPGTAQHEVEPHAGGLDADLGPDLRVVPELVQHPGLQGRGRQLVGPAGVDADQRAGLDLHQLPGERAAPARPAPRG